MRNTFNIICSQWFGIISKIAIFDHYELKNLL